MLAVLSPEWGPYGGVSDARDRLCRFVDKACGPGVGVAWAAAGVVFPLRAPHRDGAGFGDMLVFEWTGLPPPTPRPPSSFLGRVQKFIEGSLAAQGRAAIAQGQAQMALGRTIDNAIGRMLTQHRDDAAGVALDVLCVALSLALLPTGLGALGLVALAGGSVLLVADGAAYAMEMSGDEEGAESVKRNTEGIRILATLATLPDLALGGCKAVRELVEIKELRAADRATAAAAGKMGVQTASAQRAQRFAQVAERANLRAQLRTEQVSALIRLELTPRAGGAGSVGLLVREEFSSNESAMKRFLQGLRLHATATHK